MSKARAANRSSSGKPRQDTARSASRSSNGGKKRQPVDVDEIPFDVDPPKKKKKKRGAEDEHLKALESFADRFAGDLEDGEEEESAESVFTKDYTKIKKLLDPDNPNLRIDQVSIAFFRAALATILDLLPIAERAYRKSQKESAAYALTALINQARDLTSDVKMGDDVEGQAILIKKIVDMSYVGVAEMLLQEKFALQAKLDTLSSSPSVRKAMRQELDDMVRSFIKGMRAHSDLTSTRVKAFLQGDPNYMNPGEPEKVLKKRRKAKRREE